MSFHPNDAIGYTDDGQVWILIVSDCEGKQLRTIKMWSAEEAKEVSKQLSDTANVALEKRGLSGGNGGNA